MRLLIYLLAMLTGFSAAEAARPVVVAPSALGSAMAEAAAEAVVVSLEARHIARHFPDKTQSLALAVDPLVTAPALAGLSVGSPVTRFEVSRQ